jgi:hypothetical protein
MRLTTIVLMSAVVGLGCGSVSSLGDGGGGSTGNAGSTGSAGSTGNAGSTGHAGNTGTAGAPPPHRPIVVACAPVASAAAVAAPLPPPQDAGVMSCLTDNDCRPEGGIVFAAYCHNHACTPDQCFTDSDCPTGQACGCANQFGGNALHANRCVPTACHTDADCTSGLCSPANTGYCGSFQGYHCRGAADTCRADTDCASPSTGGVTLPRSCQFAPEVGHWQCAPVTVCTG